MSNSIEQHNVTAEGYKALVDAVTTQLTKAGFKIETKIALGTGNYTGCWEETTFRVIFGESDNKIHKALKARLAAAKAKAAELVAKHNIVRGEMHYIDDVLDMLDDPYAAFDHTANVVAMIRGTNSNNVPGKVDTIGYSLFNVYPAYDRNKNWDGVTTRVQRSNAASTASINRWTGRPINPESTAKRLVKIIADNMDIFISSNLLWIERADDDLIAKTRRENAASKAFYDKNEGNRQIIASALPCAILSKVEQSYSSNSIKLEFHIKLEDLKQHLPADSKYPSSSEILEAVVAYIRSKQ